MSDWADDKALEILDLAYMSLKSPKDGIASALRAAAEAERDRFAIRTAVEAERERLATMIETYAMERKPGEGRMVLAIAAQDVRRGRRLTETEKMDNFEAALREIEGKK